MTAPPGLAEAYAGPVDLTGLDGPDALDQRQARWRLGLAKAIYGPMPEPPETLEVTTSPIPDARAERVTISLEDRQGNPHSVDAALWRPEGEGPAPLITGLSFAGPAGILTGNAFPLDPRARVFSRPEFGADGRLSEALRGTEAPSWPVEWLTSKGYAVLVSCYGSWCPDDAEMFEVVGLRPFLGVDTRAVSLWGWAISRMIDAGARLGGLDMSRVVVAGHSRLGKAALWAAAHDARIGAVMSNASGCGGSAPSRHEVGETLEQMAKTFPHWILPQSDPHDLDQHHLLGAIAPRQVYLSLAADDLWADPLGSVMGLATAAPLWDQPMDWPTPDEIWNGLHEVHHPDLGFHIRPGGHALLPYDWHRFLAFLDGG